jgi:ribosomal protein S27E
MDKIDDFLAKLKEMNCNKTSGDMDYDKLFGKDAPFAIVCNKCGSMNIEIIGEQGYMVSEETGWDSGTTVVKCKGCGNANTVYH